MTRPPVAVLTATGGRAGGEGEEGPGPGEREVCAVCRVQCAVCSVQCVVCCMQSSVCNRHKKNHFQDKFASYVIYRFKNMPLD